MKKGFFFLLVGVLLLSGSLVAAKRAFTLEDLYRVKSVSDIQVSPDGKWVIFRSNMFGPTQVFAVEVAKAK